jgi:hypothetical protein
MNAMGTGRATLTLIPYEEPLLAKAQELITKGDMTKGDFSIAVVVAHLACEISAERAILRAFAAKGIKYRKDNFSGFNLASNRLSNLYNAVTGDEIQKKFSSWKAFKKSANRRNEAVHNGKIITKTEAEDSYKAASDLVAYLK